MLVNKMGSYHVEYGKNNQDYGFEYKNIGCIVDGCSDGKHSEVGAKLFVKKFLEKVLDNEEKEIYPLVTIDEVVSTFDLVARLITRFDEKGEDGNFLDDMKDYMCFSIMVLVEKEEEWMVIVFGDGFVFLQENGNDDLKFESINHSSHPNYLAYHLIDRRFIKNHEKGMNHVRFYTHYLSFISKEKFQSVGIASDGIRYIIGTEHEQKFNNMVLKRNKWGLMRFINILNRKNDERGGFFKDDITLMLKGGK